MKRGMLGSLLLTGVFINLTGGGTASATPLPWNHPDGTVHWFGAGNLELLGYVDRQR